MPYYPNVHFTKAVSVNSIFYWADAARALSELARVLEAAHFHSIALTRHADRHRNF